MMRIEASLSRLSAVVGVVALLAIASPAQPTWSAEPVKKGKAIQGTKGAKGSKARAGKAVGGDLAAKGTACFGDTPRIEKVKPDVVKAGDKVTITGLNFGVPGCLTSVSFGPGRPASFHHKNETTVTAVVPAVKKKGLALLSVTTASGEASKPVLVK